MRRGHLLPGHRRSLRRVGHSAHRFHLPRGERQRGGRGHRLLQVSLHTACAPPVWLRLPDACPLPLLLLLPPFSSTWTPKGDHVASNTDECMATLSYAVSLKKPGTVTFEYFYPDNSIYFEFFVSIARLHMRGCFLGPDPDVFFFVCRFRTTSVSPQSRRTAG